MAIAVKKFGDPHIYTVLSYDDIEHDPYYCCVKYDPAYRLFSHPFQVNLAENDWERVDRKEVELFARDWIDILSNAECFEFYQIDHGGPLLEIINTDIIKGISSVIHGAGRTFETYTNLRNGMLGVFKKQVRFMESENLLDKVNENYSRDTLIEMLQIWSRTNLIQPHVIIEHIQIINHLILEKQSG